MAGQWLEEIANFSVQSDIHGLSNAEQFTWSSEDSLDDQFSAEERRLAAQWLEDIAGPTMHSDTDEQSDVDISSNSPTPPSVSSQQSDVLQTMEESDSVIDDETMETSGLEEAQQEQHVDSNEQGHIDDLFCPLHIVRFWDSEKRDTHNHYMHPSEGLPTHNSIPLFEPQRALDCIAQYDFNLAGYDFKDFRKLLDCVQSRVNGLLSDGITRSRGIKASIRTYVEFERIVPSDILDNIICAWFTNLDGERGANGTMKILLHPDAIPNFVEDTIVSVEERVSIFVKATSGLRVRRIVKLNMLMLDYQPISGGTFKETPWVLRDYKSQHIINVDNSAAAATSEETRHFDISLFFLVCFGG